MQTWVTWLQAMWLTSAFPDIEIISIIYLPFCFVALVKPIDKRNYHGPHKRWSKLMWPFQHVMICRVHEIYIYFMLQMRSSWMTQTCVKVRKTIEKPTNSIQLWSEIQIQYCVLVYHVSIELTPVNHRYTTTWNERSASQAVEAPNKCSKCTEQTYYTRIQRPRFP